MPYDKYVFFNLLTEASGGLEHRNSVMMMAADGRWRRAPTYVDWLSLASHEFFHLWNVKRLRPIELGPFDYENEIYPRSLWIAEGLTDYYGDLQVRARRPDGAVGIPRAPRRPDSHAADDARPA